MFRRIAVSTDVSSRRRSSSSRSISATDSVTWPLITTPLSSTRLGRSLRTSDPPSRSSSRSLIAAPEREVIRWPWSGEIETEARWLSRADDGGEPLLKRPQAVGRDEKGSIENHLSRRLGRHAWNGRRGRLERERGQLGPDLAGDSRAGRAEALLDSFVELPLEEVSLAR